MAYIFQPDRYLLIQQIKRVAPYVRGRVLDVGAGEVDRYSHYFSFDTCTRMDVRHAKSVDIVGSADAIPLSSESMDSVICTQVFEHLSNPVKAAQEIYRVLAPGGVAIVTVPQTNELHEEPFDYFRYTRYGIKHIFESAGFETILEEQRGGFFSTVAQMRIRYCIDRFHLYRHPMLAKLVGFPLKLYGKWSIFLDSKDRSIANSKHAMGGCFVFNKEK
jgi:SAM-dependent methyltransferase